MTFFNERIEDLTDKEKKLDDLFLKTEESDAKMYIDGELGDLVVRIDFLKSIRENIPDCAGDSSIRMLVSRARGIVHDLSKLSPDIDSSKLMDEFILRVQLDECYQLIGRMVASR